MYDELAVAESRIHLALNNMHDREKRLQNMRSKRSLHYNRVAHTKAIITMLSELLGAIKQDPDNWEIEPDIAPF